MPNIVANILRVTSNSPLDMAAFLDRVQSRPDNAHPEQTDFSFHSFITYDEKPEDELGWNVTNWGTKWDADVDEIRISVDPTTAVHVWDAEFSTAWNAPKCVVAAMAKEFPTLTFDHWWEEEQGYGEQYVLHGDTLHTLDSWDIPASHADYLARGKECECYFTAPKGVFSDCPSAGTFVVRSITEYTISAMSLEEAIEAAKAEDSGLDLPDDVKVIDVEYAALYTGEASDTNTAAITKGETE